MNEDDAAFAARIVVGCVVAWFVLVVSLIAFG